jgi:soluble lytic murein transglycosylase-like protein
MTCPRSARFLVAVSVVASVATAVILEQKANLPGPSPKTLLAVPLSPEEVTYIYRQEQRQAEYVAAVRAARQVLVANGCSSKYAAITGRAAVDSQLPARMVAALVFVESSCRANAVSKEGAVGLTQVNPRVWRYSRRALQDPYMNLQIGTRILAGYIRVHGLREGLHRYNGLGDPSEDYSERVLQAAYRPIEHPSRCSRQP